MKILQLLQSYWKGQTFKEKTFAILVLFFLIYISVLGAQKAFYKYKYLKQVEKQVVTLKDSIKAYNVREKELIKLAKTNTIIIREKVITINAKLKQDEKIIDDRIVTNDDIDKFLASYD